MVTINCIRIGNEFEAAIAAAIATSSLLLIVTVLFIAVMAILVTRHRAKTRAVLHHSAIAQDTRTTRSRQNLKDAHSKELIYNSAYASAKSSLNPAPAIQLQANASYVPIGEIELEVNASYTLNGSIPGNSTTTCAYSQETQNVPMTTNPAYVSSAQHIRAS